MYHVFKIENDRYHLLLPNQKLWGKKWNNILGTDGDQVDAFNKRGNYLCRSCYFLKIFNVQHPQLLKYAKPEDLRMVIQTRNLPAKWTEKHQVELHSIEAFVLFPENDPNGNPNYCPHILFSHPFDCNISIDDAKSLAAYKGVYARTKSNPIPYQGHFPDVITDFKTSSENQYTLTTGYRKFDQKHKWWKNPSGSNDLMIWPKHWEGLMIFTGHASPFGKIQHGVAHCANCSICERQIKI